MAFLEVNKSPKCLIHPKGFFFPIDLLHINKIIFKFHEQKLIYI